MYKSKLLWWNFQNKVSKRFLLKNNPLYVRVAFVIHIKLTFRLYGKFWAFFSYWTYSYCINTSTTSWCPFSVATSIGVSPNLFRGLGFSTIWWHPLTTCPNVAHCVLFCFFGQVNDSSPFCLVTRSEAILGPFLLLKIRVFQNFIANVDWSIHNQFSYLVK